MGKSVLAGADVYPTLWVRRVTTGRAGSKAVLYTLATHANLELLRCWVEMKKLAKESDMKPPAAKDNIDKLAQLGLIASIPLVRRSDGQQTSSMYVLNIDGWLDDAPTAEEVLRRCEHRAKVIKGEQFEEAVPSRFRVAAHLDGFRLPIHRKQLRAPTRPPGLTPGAVLLRFPRW